MGSGRRTCVEASCIRRAGDGERVGGREDGGVLQLGDRAESAQAFLVTLVLLVDYVSVLIRSAQAQAVDVRTHQNRRHIFKTPFPTSYRPQCDAEAGRIYRIRLAHMPPLLPWRSSISIQVTTYQGYLGRVRIHLASTLKNDKRGRVPCSSTPSRPSEMFRQRVWDMPRPIVGAGCNGG